MFTYGGIYIISLIERDLGRLLVRVYVLVERAISIVGLLLDGGAELEEFLGNGLLGGSEDVDEAEEKYG